MKKLIVLLTFIIICLCGCTSDNKTERSVDADNIIMSYETELDDNALIEASENHETVNKYESYVGKIWVPQKYDEMILDHFHGSRNCYFTFYISKIDDKNIEGKFRIGYPAFDVAYPPCYKMNWNEKLGDFAGTIDGNKAECIFVDKSRENWHQNGDQILEKFSMFCSSGYLTIEFSEDMTCDVSVKYIYNYLEENKEFCSTYRPYNVSDYDVISNNTKVTKNVNLDNWGNINVETVLINSSKLYSMIFFTDDTHDIIYQLPSYPPAIPNSILYSEIEIIDLDQDGIDDIRLTPFDYDWDEPMDIEPIEYYQRKDGLLFESYLNMEGIF